MKAKRIPKLVKPRLNLPVPEQLKAAVTRLAGRANQHVNEFVEAILRKLIDEQGIDLSRSLEDVNRQMDGLGFPRLPDKSPPRPTAARDKRAA